MKINIDNWVIDVEEIEDGINVQVSNPARKMEAVLFSGNGAAGVRAMQKLIPQVAPVQIGVQSFTNPCIRYIVTAHADGRYECTCPHFVTHLESTGQHCKHIHHAIAELL